MLFVLFLFHEKVTKPTEWNFRLIQTLVTAFECTKHPIFLLHNTKLQSAELGADFLVSVTRLSDCNTKK
jgi:hypothetical protein